MNFATPAVILLLIFLPGVLFRGAYLRGSWKSHPFKMGSLVEEIGYGAALALGLHSIWLLIATSLGYPADLEVVLSLAYGPSSDNGGFGDAKHNAANNAMAIGAYLSTLYVFSAILGYLLHCAVRGSHWDRHPNLRFPHHWAYLFSGEQMNLPAADTKTDGGTHISVTLVALLVEISDASYVYRGELEDYYFDSSGQLDRLLVAHPSRAKLCELERLENEATKAREAGEDPQSLSDAFHEVEDSYMVFFVKEIKNLHVAYAQFRKLTPEQEQGVESPEPGTASKPARKVVKACLGFGGLIAGVGGCNFLATVSAAKTGTIETAPAVWSSILILIGLVLLTRK